MNIYMAAVHSNRYCEGEGARHDHLNEYEKQIVNATPHMLESYHYIWRDTFVDAIRLKGDRVFIDSGAFSAYTLGVIIDLPTYCQYILENNDIIRYDEGVMLASVLDGIGDAEETWRNQQAMESLGVRPLPCFHAGEPEEYLERYVANYDYITLGGMVGVSTKQLMIWLDRVWSKYLVDGSGNPKIKVHGFGITSVPVMERYPWWSCDSSSWIQSASYGTIIHPKYGPISVSAKSPDRHDYGRHISNLPEGERRILEEAILRDGFELERLGDVYESRAVYNIRAFWQMNYEMNQKPVPKFRGEKQELF